MNHKNSIQLQYKKKEYEKETSASQLKGKSIIGNEIDVQRFDSYEADTLAQAYPMVLNLLREKMANHKINEEQPKRIKLIDIKIVLKTPLKDVIPAYFDDRVDLKKIANDAFFNEDGLFSRILNENDQLNNKLKHVADTINKRDYSSQSSVFELYNDSSNTSKLNFLLLKSIWIVAKWKEKCITIDYGFHWTKVEAILGFPFSMYATIKYSEWLNTQIQKRVIGEKHSLIEMGYLTYFAHNLHVKNDEFSFKFIKDILIQHSV